MQILHAMRAIMMIAIMQALDEDKDHIQIRKQLPEPTPEINYHYLHAEVIPPREILMIGVK